jgi:hypothetical protein
MTFLTTDNATKKIHNLSVKLLFIFGLLPCFCKMEHLKGNNLNITWK